MMTQPSNKGYWISLVMVIVGLLLIVIGFIVDYFPIMMLGTYPTGWSIIPTLIQRDLNKNRREWIEREKRMAMRHRASKERLFVDIETSGFGIKPGLRMDNEGNIEITHYSIGPIPKKKDKE